MARRMKVFFEYVIDGLRLVEKDALGGAGSRGCGQVKFFINVSGEKKTLSDINASDFPTIE